MEIFTSITSSELQNKYLTLASSEDIFITQEKKIIAELSNPFQDRINIAKSLFGIVPCTVTLEEAREEKINEL